VLGSFADEFLNTAIRDWIDKITEFNTKASVKDAKSVQGYLKFLQSKYGKLPEG